MGLVISKWPAAESVARRLPTDFHRRVFTAAIRSFEQKDNPLRLNNFAVVTRNQRISWLMYAMGIAALANSNYRFLRTLMEQKISPNSYKPERPAAQIMHNLAIPHDQQKFLPEREREYTPLCNHLFETLREPLRECLPDDRAYETTFDWFECLLCLAHADQSVTRQKLQELKENGSEYYIWGPVGRFGWKAGDDSIVKELQLGLDGSLPEKITLALQAGFFEPGDGTKNR